jgi:hypothetical protein
MQLTHLLALVMFASMIHHQVVRAAPGESAGSQIQAFRKFVGLATILAASEEKLGDVWSDCSKACIVNPAIG